MSATLATSPVPRLPRKQVKVLSRATAEAWGDFGVMPLISIQTVGHAQVTGSHILRLQFDDIEEKPPYDPGQLGGPSLADAARIIEWCDQHAYSDIIAVHCRMGISRSAAVATYLVSRGYWCAEDLTRAHRGLCRMLGVPRLALSFEPPESESP